MWLARYWLEFDTTVADRRDPDRRCNPFQGRVGVTGWDLDDCLSMVRNWWYDGGTVPPLTKVIEDVDVSAIDLRGWESLGVPVWRGIWCPGYNLHLPGAWPSEPPQINERLRS